MPTGPSRPRIPIPKPTSPRPREAILEGVKEEERKQIKRRRGYASTIMTRGMLGTAQTQKAKALGV